MIEYNPIYKKNGSLNGAITTAPSNSLIFDLAGKAIWAKGVKLKGTDHTYTFSHDNYITLTNTPGSDESEDIKIGVNITTLKAAIDTTYSVVTASSNGLAPMFSSGNLADTDNTDHYYLGIKGSTLKWYKNAYRQLKVGDNVVLGVTDRDPLQIVSADSNLSVSWNSTNKLLVIKNEKPAIGDLTDINVSQFKVTDNTNYRLLFKGTANDNNYTGVSRFSEYLLFNPSTKLLTINGNRVITAVDVYVGATSEANATVGLVPAATSAQRTYFLRGDGTWLSIVQENTWRPIKVNSSEKLGSGTDTGAVDFVAGTGITLGWDATNKRITITNSAPDQDHNTDRTGIKLGTVSGTKVTNSTLIIANSGTGLSIAGGTNLIKIGDGTNYIEVPITINHGLSTKNITINGAAYALYTSANSLPTFVAPGSYGTANYILATNSSGDGLTWVAKPTSNVTTTAIVGNSATATSQITSAQTNPYYNLLEGGLVTRSIRFVAGTGITISAATDGLITITNTSPDLNHNTDRTGIYKGTVSGTKKIDTTLIVANSSSGLIFEGGTNLFKIGDGTNYVEIPITPSFTVTDKAATIGQSLTTIATINGTDITAKIADYFKLLGWNSASAFLDANSTSDRLGLIINQQGNATSSIINYPTNYGYMLSFICGGATYSGVQIYEGTDNLFRIRHRWSSSAWEGWRIVADSSNISNKDATLTTSLVTIATIAGVKIKAKITNYNTDENVKLTPKTDNVNRPLMMINGGTSQGEQVNTSMFSTGIYANASTKMITANGFIKAGSDSSHVLLGDGDHKAWGNADGNISVNNGTVCTNLNADMLDGYHATGFLAWAWDNTTGAGSPFQASVDYFKDLTKLNNGAKLVYNSSGDEYTLLYTRRSDTTAHGTILKWGYPDKYLRIIRLTSGNPKSTDWEKIAAGNADIWTTARTLTIGNTGKSVDGSANVSWTLAEIGASAVGHTHDDRYYTETEADDRFVNVTGDSMNAGAKLYIRTAQADNVYGGGLEINNLDGTNYPDDGWSTNKFNAPRITFHWGGKTVSSLGFCGNFYRITAKDTAYTIWDSGNDGSGSGLDADLLDGTHKADLLTAASLGTSGNNTTLSVTVGGTTKTGSVTVPYATNSGNSDTVDSIHATGFLRWKGMLNIGSGAPFQAVVDIIKDTTKLNDGGLAFYSYAGAEYTVLIGSRNDATRHGSALKWGYPDKYIRIIRMVSGAAQSTDWEKISAGYADSAGNADTLDNIHANGLLTAASLGASGNSTTLSVTVGGTTKTGSVTVPYATSAGNADTVDNVHATGFFRDLGWNSSSAYVNANDTSFPFGFVINQQGNFTSNISNYPSNYGFLASFTTGSSTYTGIQLYGTSGNEFYIRDRWSSSSWYSWEKLITSGNYTSYVNPRAVSKTIWGQTYIDASGNFLNVNGLCYVTANSKTLTIGALNTSWYHFSGSDSSPFYFSNNSAFNGTVYPYTNNSFDLGTTSNRWRNLLVSGYIDLNGHGYILSGRTTSFNYGYTLHNSTNDLTNGIGIFSGPGGEEGGIVVTPDGVLLYNSSDSGWNFQCFDKDLGGDQTANNSSPDEVGSTTRTFGIRQTSYVAWSRGGFQKNGSDDNYFLLGGGGHVARSSYANASHTHPFSQITDGTSSSTNSGWSHILSNTYGGSLKSILYMCHGGGYGMHLRGYSTSSSVYMLEIYNSSSQVFAVYGDGHSVFGGNVTATNFYTTSDRNKKQNISSFSEHIRKFRLKDTEKWYYGVIAQEVEEMFREGEEGNMTVNYNSILSFYIGLLENKVRTLEERIKRLESK